MNDLKNHVRNIPDFPKKGIVFRDITTLIGHPESFAKVIDNFYNRYKDKKIDHIVCVESRGFIFGAPLAYKLNAGIIPVRKKGKLPHEILSATYELEYGQDVLEVHKDCLKKDEKIVIVDDLLATGGTTKAVIDLMTKLNAHIIEIAYLIELEFLKGRDKLDNYPIHSIVKYDSG